MRLKQRQKQIDFGKNTRGYDTYISRVPKYGIAVRESCTLLPTRDWSAALGSRAKRCCAADADRLALWPTLRRAERQAFDPVTPDKTLGCSKRAFDGQVPRGHGGSRHK